MARFFITGSTDGLGLLSAESLVSQGHKVVLYARNQQRGAEALQKVPGAETVVTADLSSIEDTKILAGKVNDLGKFDAVIHNDLHVPNVARYRAALRPVIKSNIIKRF